MNIHFGESCMDDYKCLLKIRQLYDKGMLLQKQLQALEDNPDSAKKRVKILKNTEKVNKKMTENIRNYRKVLESTKN